MTKPLRVLCLDIEGGHGGSSRSLHVLLEHMDRSRVTPVVWCRRDGPILERYAKLGIATRHVPTLPTASALPRLSRNMVQFARHGLAFVRARAALAELAEAARGVDLVHFNHEGFAALALWLRRRATCASTMHIRTNVRPSFVARAQMRAISAAVDAVVFITPNEERTFRALGGRAPGRVVFNPVAHAPDCAAHPALAANGYFNVAAVANASVQRGTDRLLDLAAAVKARGRADIRIVVAGDMALRGRWPGDLRAVAARGGTLADAAEARDLAGQFLFLGHVSEPEAVLAAAHLLVKPTRHSDPWGRDILEAMAAGVPVASVGSDTTFVETGVTGLLQPAFDAGSLADAIIALAADPVRRRALGAAARARVESLCDAPARARDVLELWYRVSRGRALP